MNGAFNEMANFNGMAALETPEFMLAQDGRVRLAELLQPLLGRLGLGDEHARSSGPSRSPRTGAAPATAPSCTGRNGIDEPGGLRSQFTHVIDVAPDDPRGGRPARADDGQRRAAVADGGHEHALHASTSRTRRSATTCSTSRCSATAASTTRAGARSPSTARPWVMVGGDAAGLRRRRLGALRRQQRLQPGPRPGRRAPRDAGQAAAALADRGHQVQRAADRRPRRRAARPRRSAGRPTLIRGNSQLFFAGMGRLSENSVVSIKNKSFSVTAEVDVPDGGAEGVIIAQGGRFGGWAVYVKDGTAQVRLQRARHPRVRHRGRRADPGRHAPGADGVRLRRRRAGQGRRRHPVLRRRAGRHRTGRGHPADGLLRRRDHRHRLRVRHHRHPRLHRRRPAGSPARSTGSRSTSATTTTTTSSTPTSASASPWPGSRRPQGRR